MAIGITTGYIVHINGPFWCGAWPDLRIARSHLHTILPDGELYLADSGYFDQFAPSVTKNEILPEERRRMMTLMARHETVNRRFKQWAILHDQFRHSEDLHEDIFTAIAVITQLEIENGAHTWVI